ncbi:glycine betaine ABC transporter substrate-binding protein [Lentzea sp. NPDC051213]|uniref:glycine betaine ABC transporter substrate-binding protein n=1 Tax=Lentzea sp. NPDC051213 TaxID=3364126 RepID=UPI0037970A01
MFMNTHAPLSRRHILGVSAAAAATAVFGAAPANATGVARTVRLGTIGLSFHRASAAVVRLLLKRAGYRVQDTEAPHEELFAAFGRHDIDLAVSAWLPGSHGRYVEPIREHVREMGKLYEPYALWGVPDYVPADQVSSVADLTTPEVAARMTKVVQGIGPGAGISRFSREIFAAYNLEALGYEFRNGTQQECEQAFETAVAERRWVVVPLWQPQHLHQIHRIRELAEPQGLLRGKDTATLLARRELRLDPLTTRALTRMHLGNAAVTEMDYAINRQGRTPDLAASEWVSRNRRTVLSWYR